MEGSDILHELDEVEFPSKLRGYDPVTVDEMLERARGEIEDLRNRAQNSDERARAAEEQVDIEIAAARQAHTEADAALVAAQEKANELVADARAEAERLLAASETEIREAIESGRNELLGELEDLQSRKDETRSDIEMGERQMAAHRDRLLSAISDLRTLIEGLTLVSTSAPSIRTAGLERDPSTCKADEQAELLTTKVDSAVTLHEVNTSALTVETESAGNFGGEMAGFRRLVEDGVTDRSAIENWGFVEGEARSRTEDL